MKPDHFSLYLQTYLRHLGGVSQQYSETVNHFQIWLKENSVQSYW
jgi:hypothetical protein